MGSRRVGRGPAAVLLALVVGLATACQDSSAVDAGDPEPSRSGIDRSRSPKGGYNEGGVPQGRGIRHGQLRVLHSR